MGVNMTRSRWLCGLVFLAACGSSAGSGSGVSGSKKLVSLSTEEQQDLCAYVNDVADGPRTVRCDDGTEVEIEANEDCGFVEVPASCDATVNDAEGCAEAQSEDPCDINFEACAALFQCAFGD